jgi:hypothetical protein
VVWEVVWIVVGDGGAGRAVSSHTRRILMNVFACCHVAPFAGL